MQLPTSIVIQEPEQDQPIDYHIPKRRGETEDENEERRNRDQRRSTCSKISKPLISVRAVIGKMPVTVSAAAGHGRGSNGTQSNGSQPSSGSSGSGMSINFGGGSTGGASGGSGIGSGTGGGGMNPGRDGRQNYGPSSPPTGSLPPFYESLKGGNNSNNFNASNYASNYNLMNGQANIDEAGQELTNMTLNGNQSPPRQYSTLQNASYGLAMKDEVDLDLYESKIDSMGNLLPGSYSGYDESMMVDMVTGAVVDPLQFTATLTFSSSAENALLESLTDASDLSSFLQRLPNEDNDNDEIIGGDLSSPSVNSESSQIPPVEQNMDNFSDHLLGRNYDSQRFPHQFSKMYSDPLPSYSSSIGNEALQVQMQQQQLLSPSLSFSGNGLDLDSPTTMSLPSPGATSCSLDGGSHNDNGSISPPANVSGRRDSTGSDSSVVHGRVNVLQRRVSSKLMQANPLFSDQMKFYLFIIKIYLMIQ